MMSLVRCGSHSERTPLVRTKLNPGDLCGVMGAALKHPQALELSDGASAGFRRVALCPDATQEAVCRIRKCIILFEDEWRGTPNSSKAAAELWPFTFWLPEIGVDVPGGRDISYALVGYNHVGCDYSDLAYEYHDFAQEAKDALSEYEAGISEYKETAHPAIIMCMKTFADGGMPAAPLLAFHLACGGLFLPPPVPESPFDEEKDLWPLPVYGVPPDVPALQHDGFAKQFLTDFKNYLKDLRGDPRESKFDATALRQHIAQQGAVRETKTMLMKTSGLDGILFLVSGHVR